MAIPARLTLFMILVCAAKFTGAAVSRPIRPWCMLHCPSGTLDTVRCKCGPPRVILPPTLHRETPCWYRNCPGNTRCVVMGRRGVCVSLGQPGRGRLVCRLPKRVGPCRARMPRYYYNRRARRCEHFFYGGCRGNENNFRSIAACQRTCVRRRY